MYWTHEINDGGVNDADEDDDIVCIPYDVNVYMWILHRQCGDPPCQNVSLSRELELFWMHKSQAGRQYTLTHVTCVRSEDMKDMSSAQEKRGSRIKRGWCCWADLQL